MNFDEIKAYWEDRATGDSSAQSTTQDFYLREIEFNAIANRMAIYSPSSVADIGCGDGRTTTRLASKFPNASFSGFDYSQAMIENAREMHDSAATSNVRFGQLDVCDGLKESFSLIYTTRCLINLPSWNLQKTALKNIHDALNQGGIYLMVENFIEGQANFNQIRNNFGLPEIPVREHNHFFELERFRDFAGGLFKIEEEINISSTYYLVSRIIYSKICAETGVQMDYFDDHHRYAAGLPFSGEFGPVRLICLRKK